MKSNRKLLFGLTLGVGSILLGAFLFINSFLFSKILADTSCITETKNEKVLGNSMEPMIKANSTIKALYGYYDCNKVKRNDIVLFSYIHNPYPLIKRTVAIPGDEFDFIQVSEGWRLTVNNRTVKNSEGNAYILNNHARTLLGIFKDQYDGVLPENIYIILGDQIYGTLDSAKFGVVDGKDFVAKAEP